MNYISQGFAIGTLFHKLENEIEVTNEPLTENEKSFANELRNEIRNEMEMKRRNEPEMNSGNDVEMNVEKIVEMNRRTTTTVEQVIKLKKKCDYTNFHSSLWYGNGKYWIEGTFYKNSTPVYQFKINCKSEQDSRTKLNQIRRCYQ